MPPKWSKFPGIERQKHIAVHCLGLGMRKFLLVGLPVFAGLLIYQYSFQVRAWTTKQVIGVERMLHDTLYRDRR